MSTPDTHHESKHDGQPVADIPCCFYHDDSETDSHPHHATKECSSSNQSVATRVKLPGDGGVTLNIM